MAQTDFNVGFDVDIRNNAQGINYDSPMQDGYHYCSDYCSAAHRHNYRPKHISHTFNRRNQQQPQQHRQSSEIPEPHICHNNCNHDHQLSQIERNRLGKQSSKKFTRKEQNMSPKVRNRRRRRNRMFQEPQKQVVRDYKATMDDKVEFPNKTDQEIGEIRHKQRQQRQVRKNMINKQRQLEKTLNDGSESLIVQANQIERHTNNQEYQSKTEEEKN